MAKAVMETNLEKRLYANLNISTAEIVQVTVDNGVVHRGQSTKIQNVSMNKLEEDLEGYYTRISEMRARVTEVQSDMKEEYLSQVENLENIRTMFSVKYGTLKKSNGDVWADLRAAIEEAWSELEF